MSTIAPWQAVANEELQAVQQQPDKERLAVVADLLRWQIEMLQDLNHAEEMVAIMKKLMPLQGATRDDVQNTIEWLIDRRAWQLVDVLIAGYPNFFADDPFLMYRHAEVLRRQNRSEAAEEIIQRIRSLPAGDEMFLHVELGYDLQTRGLFDWAEGEYRVEIESGEKGSHAAIEAAIRLGYMFHDVSKHQQGYEVLKDLVELAERDTEVKRRIQELKRTPNRIRSQMHFSHALAFGEESKWKEHCRELEESLKYDQDNADILIAMHRVPAEHAPAEWLLQTEQRVKRLQQNYAERMVRAEQDYRTLPGEMTAANLAMHSNQYAWLVANTFGDFEAALQASLRSLELMPDEAGYLDTLGRCYFANKDYENAIKHQRRAVELEPHSGQIRRQLEQFEQMAAEQQ
jgi:tetratricopeptide (TPR) repeat protein